MLCGLTPCSCFAPAPKTKAPRPKAAPVEVVDEIKRPSAAQESMRAAAAEVRRGQFARKYLTPPRPRVARVSSKTDDILFADAIRALGPLMHPEEMEKYAMILTSSPSLDDRAVAWRSRNG
jgi:hypothetical protein